jgi:phenylacetate-CoA ligase
VQAPDTAAVQIAKTLTAIAKLRGTRRNRGPGSLPNDGKVIADERDYSA